MRSVGKDHHLEAPSLLTVTETATLLRIQRAKVYDLIDTGALKAGKVGHIWRIRTSSVEEMIGPIGDLYHRQFRRGVSGGE